MGVVCCSENKENKKGVKNDQLSKEMQKNRD